MKLKNIIFLGLMAGCAPPPARFYVCQGPPPDMPFAQPPPCVEQTRGESGAVATTSAQSFVPHCGRIGAVQWGASPGSLHSTGWLRVDIAKDQKGMPGRVLTRSWVRVEKDCAVPFGGFMTFPVETIKTDADKTYWMTLDAFEDAPYVTRKGVTPLANMAVSTHNPYPEGRMIQGSAQEWDAVFRILPDFQNGQVPLQTATAQTLATLPPEPYRSASWQEAEMQWTQNLVAGLPPELPAIPFSVPLETIPEGYERRPIIPGSQLPQGCWVPDKFPDQVVAAVPAVPGLHGLVVLAGTSPGICKYEKSCRVFTKREFEDLWDCRIEGFMNEALFSVSRCDLPTEIESRLKTQSQAARRRSSRALTPAMQASLEAMSGEWCGKTVSQPDQGTVEMRVTFTKEGAVIKGHAVTTWPRAPGGPVGTAGYVDTLDLFPVESESADAALVTFSEVSRYRTGVRWTLDPAIPSLTSHQLNLKTFMLSRSCGGYWKEAK